MKIYEIIINMDTDFAKKNESIFGFVAHVDKIRFANDTGNSPNQKIWAVLTLMKAK